MFQNLELACFLANCWKIPQNTLGPSFYPLVLSFQFKTKIKHSNYSTYEIKSKMGHCRAASVGNSPHAETFPITHFLNILWVWGTFFLYYSMFIFHQYSAIWLSITFPILKCVPQLQGAVTQKNHQVRGAVNETMSKRQWPAWDLERKHKQHFISSITVTLPLPLSPSLMRLCFGKRMWHEACQSLQFLFTGLCYGSSED